MTDMVLRGLPDALLDAIRRRAEARGVSAEVEAEAILRDAMSRELPAIHGVAAKMIRPPLTTGRGLGSELAAIGREFGITTEFDGLRDNAPIDAAKFD